MLLNGFGFSGYRSIGNTLAKVSPLKKVNFIIGKNNSGKSNLIKFLKEQYPYFLSKVKNNPNQNLPTTFASLDEHISNEENIYKIAFSLHESEIQNYINSLKNYANNHHNRHLEYIDKLLRSFMDENNVIWFVYQSKTNKGPFILERTIEDVVTILNHPEWGEVWRALTGHSNGDLREHWVPEVLKVISFYPDSTPAIEVIPAIRQIGKSGSQARDYSGEGIISRLAELQNPLLEKQHLKDKFHKINKFLKDVLNNQTAEIEIPHDREMVLVHMDDKTLPLESLGTGVHEVIILAAASTLLDETVLCVEEPELHLHPLLQRKLVSYLSENTTNQYFFTTHSAHLLDAVEAEIFHVTYQDGESIVTPISSTEERSDICKDLGYKASDILQSNCVIWVEGPSDRTYLNYWIKSNSPELSEGIHYSIMFYGGRLASHLSGLDIEDYESDFEDFISLRQLNRNSVIVIDSDREAKGKRINQTKSRLKNEFDQGNGFAWVTKGREIENYLIDDKVEESVMEVHPSATKIVNKGEWANLLIYKNKHNKKTTANKVKVAKYYTENFDVDLTVLDLKFQIQKVCDLIKEVN